MMKVKRDGEWYPVIDVAVESQEVCVEDIFDFAEPPYRRTLKLWWKLIDCEEIEFRRKK